MQEPVQNPEDIHANEANVGKCIDFEIMVPVLRQEGPILENYIGWKIIDIVYGEAAVHGQVQQLKKYKVKSDYGNGNEERKVWRFEVKDIYNCPGGMHINGANDILEELPGVEGVNRNNNENMKGGKRKYKKTRKVRKSKKTRKGRKGSRK